MDKQILTNSSLTTFKICPRKYQIRYEQGYVPVYESEPLYFGKLIHKGIEAWSKNRVLDDGLDAIYEMAKQATGKDEFVVAKVHALLEGYHNHYKEESYEYVAAEVEFEAPLLNPETSRESQNFVLKGVVDRIVKDSGRFILLETKTTSEYIEDQTSDYWANLQMDSQISAYYLGLEVLGYKTETCLYDVIRKPAMHPFKSTPEDKRQYKKDGTLYANQREKDESVEEYFNRVRADIVNRPNYYYARREVPRLAKDLEDFLFDAWNTAKTLREYQIQGKWPRHTRSCIGIYGTCPYFQVCTSRANLDDQSLYEKSETKHPELGGTK